LGGSFTGSGAGIICSTGLGGSGKTAGSGGLGCTISTVNASGIFLIASNLKLGITTNSKVCSKMEQTIAQISIFLLMPEFLIEMSKSV
jgi:hypothetical protein